MHASAIAARPAVLYWNSETVGAMQQVWSLRQKGVDVYFTADAGPNLKLLFEKRSIAAVCEEFPTLQVVEPFAY
jgi:diphosphomevalonate decarboxylase